MPRADTRTYAVTLSLSHAEALQDALEVAEATAMRENNALAPKRLNSPAAAADYAYAVKRLLAVQELRRQIGKHI